VARFVEKPERPAAEAMLAEGGHFWNSGIFLFRADRILEELEAHAPALVSAVEDAHAALRDLGDGAFEVPLEPWQAVAAAPIDKAVMERAARIAVVPCDPAWSDLGSWQAVWEQLPKDERGNAVEGDVVLDEASGCLVLSRRRLVAGSGLRDLAIIDTDDALLVADRASGDAVRHLVAALKDAGRPEAAAPAEEQRPWGRFRVLHEGPGVKVKEIVVEPGGRLSLQSHEHRAEHWVVVAGTAKVTVGDEIRTLEPNQSVHIPLGARHRMENPGLVPMHLIEVQCGTYMGEDDIIRYEDVYGRS
jgi:mannose-1-phosphate guanylyltransferase/mannose-6-phosphate isomerase